MSGDSTKEWLRYLCAGSRGWSIVNAPADFESVPLTRTLPLNKPAKPVVESPTTPLPFGDVPYTPKPEPACEPHTPTPRAPVPLLIPRTPTDPAPAAVGFTRPSTPIAFA